MKYRKTILVASVFTVLCFVIYKKNRRMKKAEHKNFEIKYNSLNISNEFDSAVQNYKLLREPRDSSHSFLEKKEDETYELITRYYKSKPWMIYQLNQSTIVNTNGFIWMHRKGYFEKSLEVSRMVDKHNHQIWKNFVGAPKGEMQKCFYIIAEPNLDCYFHWMFNAVPKLFFLKETGVELKNVYIPPLDRKFQFETLKALNINVDLLSKETPPIDGRILYPYIPNVIKENELPICYEIDPTVIEILNSIFSSKSDLSLGKKVFISRKKANHRKIINQDEVDQLFLKFNYKIAYLEDYSLFEQASIFKNAEIVVSTHGAGLTNIIFCNTGTKVLEIFPTQTCLSYKYPINHELQFFVRICKIKGFPYYMLFGHSEKTTFNCPWEENISNFSIDLNELEQQLEILQTPN